MCRMCIVDIDTGRGAALQPRCMIPVADGMVVDTESPATKKAQDGVLEFLLINHPLDCPVCDKGGECPLQDNAYAYGPGESRFVEEKRHFEKPIPISDLVLLDRERCILCDRCTRFAKEVAGDPLIHFQRAGQPDRGQHLPRPPVRLVLLRQHRADLPGRRAHRRAVPLQGPPVGRREGRVDLHDVLGRLPASRVESSRNHVLAPPGRRRRPRQLGLAVRQGSLRPTRPARARAGSAGRSSASGDELVATVAGARPSRAAAEALRLALDAEGADRLGVLGGARLTNEAAYAWAKLAKGVLGTDNVDCQLGDGLPAEVVFGLPRATIDDVCADGGTVLLLAPDLKEELPVLFLRLRDAVLEHGVKVVELAPADTSMHAAGGGVAALPAGRGRRRRPVAGRSCRWIGAGRRRPRRRPGAAPAGAERPRRSSSAGRRWPSRQSTIVDAAAALADAFPGAARAHRAAAGQRPRRPRHGPRARPPARPRHPRRRPATGSPSAGLGRVPGDAGLDTAGDPRPRRPTGASTRSCCSAPTRSPTSPTTTSPRRALAAVPTRHRRRHPPHGVGRRWPTVVLAGRRSGRGRRARRPTSRAACSRSPRRSRRRARRAPTGSSPPSSPSASAATSASSRSSGIWDEIERLAPSYAGITAELLAWAARRATGVLMPLDPDQLARARRRPRHDRQPAPRRRRRRRRGGRRGRGRGDRRGAAGGRDRGQGSSRAERVGDDEAARRRGADASPPAAPTRPALLELRRARGADRAARASTPTACASSPPAPSTTGARSSPHSPSLRRSGRAGPGAPEPGRPRPPRARRRRRRCTVVVAAGQASRSRPSPTPACPPGTRRHVRQPRRRRPGRPHRRRRRRSPTIQVETPR